MTEPAPFPPTSSDAEATRETLRLSGPADLVAAIPHLVGFAPESSLVLVALATGRQAQVKAVLATLRVDLHPDPMPLLMPFLLMLGRQRSSGVVAVFYPDPGSGDHVPAVVAQLQAALDNQGVGLLDALRVRPEPGGWRWWSELCRRAECCPAQGRRVEATAPAVVEAVGRGLVALPSRRDIEQELAADPVRVAAVAGALTDVPRVPGLDRWAWCVGEVRWLDTLVHAADVLPVPEVAARALVALTDLQVRDAMLQPPLGLHSASRLWAQLVTCAPVPWRAAPATLLAVGHLAHGGGARLTVALDVALTADPDYRLASLLNQAVLHAVPPPQVLECLTAAASDLRDGLDKRN